MNYTEILDLLTKKDKTGLEALYASYGQKFYTYGVKKWFLNEDDAWDVVYKTLETLVLKLPEYEFESQSHFDNLIFKIFVNFLRQTFRKNRKNQQNKVYLEDLENNPDEETDEEELGETMETQLDRQSFEQFYSSGKIENPKLLQLKEVLADMNSTDRDILLLRAQNYSYEEISGMLKIENNQLKVKHHRLRKKLLELLNYKIA
ncbi:MAG: sigma factor-like helix-turn-helix DNA-binding protein [Ferruginibacter sp.]